eukprot:TRINITY_DN893_c1_g1_i2.p1 TRINITY_DN893_c1_g1~~TRINITY_DN893_c1_g1_i2.p1  ORF type:complete len:108 (-),score=14.22 TRINITY_DN893_c1_g1_i2:93-416(-)
MISSLLSGLAFTALPSISFSSILVVTIAAIVVYAVLESLHVARITAGIPGPSFVWPFLGSLIQMIFDPYPFWHNQDTYGPISWNKLLSFVFFFTRDANLSRQIFATA